MPHPARQSPPKQRPAESHELDHQDYQDEGALLNRQPTLQQRRGGENRGHADDGLDAVVVDQVSQQIA
jgi:hypothetical protein